MAKAREKIKIDLDNIEELFGLIEMSFRLGKVPKLTRDSMVYTIAKTLELAILPPGRRPRIGVPVKKGEEASIGLHNLPQLDTIGQMDSQIVLLDMYQFFALFLAGRFDEPSRRPSRKNTVITFNYDLVLDDALLRLGLQPLYGHESQEPAPAEGVTVLKLHGSANWGVCSRCEKPMVLRDKITRTFSEFQSMACQNCGADHLQPLLVPPSWDKNDYHDTLRPVWQAAVEELKSATRICVVGYSLPDSDAFFRYLITLALAENHRLEKLIVVDQVGADPGLNDSATRSPVEQKWIRLLDPVFLTRRFRFYGNGIQHYLCNGSARRELGRSERVADGLASYPS